MHIFDKSSCQLGPTYVDSGRPVYSVYQLVFCKIKEIARLLEKHVFICFYKLSPIVF